MLIKRKKLKLRDRRLRRLELNKIRSFWSSKDSNRFGKLNWPAKRRLEELPERQKSPDKKKKKE